MGKACHVFIGYPQTEMIYLMLLTSFGGTEEFEVLHTSSGIP